MINPVSLFDVDTTPKPIDNIIISGKRGSQSNADIAFQAGPAWTVDYVALRWQELREHWTEEDCAAIEENRTEGCRPDEVLPSLQIPRTEEEVTRHVETCWPAWQEELVRYLCVPDVTIPIRTSLKDLAHYVEVPPLLWAYCSAQNRLLDTLDGHELPFDVDVGEFEADDVYALDILPEPPRTLESIEDRVRQLRGTHWNSQELETIWSVGQSHQATDVVEDSLARLMSDRLRSLSSRCNRSWRACRHRYLRLIKKSRQIQRRMQLEMVEALAIGIPIDSRRDLSSRMTGYIRGQDSENHDGLMKFMIYEGTQKSLVTFDADGFESSITGLRAGHGLTREAAIVRYVQERSAELDIKGRRRQPGGTVEPEPAEPVADPDQSTPALEEVTNNMASLTISPEAPQAET